MHTVHKFIHLLEDRNVVIDFPLVFLSNAFSNPYNVTTLLFLQFHEGIKDAEMKLTFKRERVEFHFVLEKPVLQGLFSGVSTSAIEQSLVVLNGIKETDMSGRLQKHSLAIVYRNQWLNWLP